MTGQIRTTTETNNASRPGYKIEDILVAHPPRYIPWINRHPSIEDTGRGTTLCYETWGARLFYSDEKAVREAVDKFCEDYNDACRRVREDPAHDYGDVTNFNDLYYLLGIVPSTLGDAWGYTTSEDYAITLKFRIEYVYPTENEIADMFGCQVLIIEPAYPNCYPDFYYREY